MGGRVVRKSMRRHSCVEEPRGAGILRARCGKATGRDASKSLKDKRERVERLACRCLVGIPKFRTRRIVI